uniref:Uncharacterized protein n=1 Tax=Anopheles darlingi TaxID=43151 RepID=A0A2M4DB97_ANODA
MTFVVPELSNFRSAAMSLLAILLLASLIAFDLLSGVLDSLSCSCSSNGKLLSDWDNSSSFKSLPVVAFECRVLKIRLPRSFGGRARLQSIFSETARSKSSGNFGTSVSSSKKSISLLSLASRSPSSVLESCFCCCCSSPCAASSLPKWPRSFRTTDFLCIVATDFPLFPVSVSDPDGDSVDCVASWLSPSSSSLKSKQELSSLPCSTLSFDFCWLSCLH